MKKLTVLVVAIGLMLPVMAQKVAKDDYNSLQVSFTTGEMHIGQTVLDGETFSTLTIDGYIPSTYVGSPNLPVFSRLIEVPLCDGYKVSVTDAVYDTIGPVKHWVVPTQPSRRKSDTSAAHLVISRDVYSQDAFIGDQEAFVESVGIARDRKLARLQFSPVRYNPVSGQIIVCRQATVTVSYNNPDVKATEEFFNRYFSPAFNNGANALNSLYPKSVSTAAPVRYLIVANSMFRGYLDTFVQWKRRKGFLTDIVYTDDAAVGTTTSSIQAYLQSQYTNATTANPAPTFVLFVGDVAQIPVFNGTAYADPHVTDLYYCTWTSSDNVPDCYYGRFSAQNVEQLIPQIQKTLMYEQYTFADPSFLDRAVMVAGVDRGYSSDNGYRYGDPAMDYAITNYINGAHGFSNVYYFKNNTSIVPAGTTNVTVSGNGSSNVATIRNLYNQGAGFINYSAHGSSSGWANPSFSSSDVANMTNSQKFGIMIGNCCQTSMFGEDECFAEALLRKGNYCGAIGYIGGSESTYWGEDFYWAVGVRSSIGPTMSMAYYANNLGVYDRAFHTHGESFSNWITNQGSIIYYGNMAVQASGSDKTLYYWEIYHLMGDPSVMNYLTQASVMTVTAPSAISYGTSSLTVIAAPYAYVALTDTTTHTVVAAAWANASGQATLQLSTTLPIGGYEIAASAPQYRTAFRSLTIVNPNAPFASVSSITPEASLIAGDTVMLSLVVNNAGYVEAQNVTVHLEPSSPMLTLLTDSLNLGDIAANGQLTVDDLVYAVVNPDAIDGTVINIVATVSWTGCTTPVVTILPLTLVAPVAVLELSTPNLSMMPGTSTNVTATVRNNGHAMLQSMRLTASSPASLLTVTPASTATVNLAPGDSLTTVFTIAVDNQMPTSFEIPISLQITSPSVNFTDTLPVFIGESNIESFENNFSFNGWTQSSSPWIVTSDTYHTGSHAIRSAQNLSDYYGESETSITCTYTRADSIAFYYKVSSESNYDKFHFYIDNTDMITDNNSGEVDWTRAAFPISAGTHTFKFAYKKDSSQQRGSDCAWVDDVTMPRTVHNVTFVDIDTCYNGTEPLPAYTVAPDMSVTIYNYTIRHYAEGRDTMAACDSVLWNGTIHTASISFLDTLPGIDQCDSIVGVDIIVYPSFTDTVSFVCRDHSYTWNDSVYTVNGEYTQLLATEFDCDSMVTLILTFDTTGIGIATIDGSSINVYPNPTANTVHFSRSVDEAVLFDLNGRMLVRRNDTKSLDMATLPNGTYVLRLRNGNATATCRIVKQ